LSYKDNATAEESAAASQEMSSMASVLKRLIAQFRLRGNNNAVNQHSLQRVQDSRNLALRSYDE
jgi:hypothetical protein